MMDNYSYPLVLIDMMVVIPDKVIFSIALKGLLAARWCGALAHVFCNVYGSIACTGWVKPCLSPVLRERPPLSAAGGFNRKW